MFSSFVDLISLKLLRYSNSLPGCIHACFLYVATTFLAIFTVPMHACVSPFYSLGLREGPHPYIHTRSFPKIVMDYADYASKLAFLCPTLPSFAQMFSIQIVNCHMIFWTNLSEVVACHCQRQEHVFPHCGTNRNNDLLLFLYDKDYIYYIYSNSFDLLVKRHDTSLFLWFE